MGAAAVALPLALPAAAAVPPPPPPPVGWVGVYHAAGGIVRDGANTSAFDIASWGIVAPVNAPAGMSFADDIAFHCDTKDVNQLYGMLIARSEGGTYSNPNDTSLMLPLAHSRGPPRGPPIPPEGVAGMLQGAARWSTLARTVCPQVAGVVVDDFWGNYEGGHGTPPPPGPPGACASCPASRPHVYGSGAAGLYCCHVPVAGGHCDSTVEPRGPCCLWPGSAEGCQHSVRCGANPKNETPCSWPSEPPAAGQGLSLEHMRNIKAALMGKTILPNSTVDHSSPATTPHLRLAVVTYQEQIAKVETPLVEQGIVDGISFWISGPSQKHSSAQLTSLVGELRTKLPPSVPIFTGGYITYSSIGWMEPEPFYDLLSQSVALYDANVIQGFYTFAGSVLQSMNASLWQTWDLPGNLRKEYFPYLGKACVTVMATGEDGTELQLSDAIATVVFGSTHVTRKKVRAAAAAAAAAGGCSFAFGGWTGKVRQLPHTVTVVADGFETAVAQVQLTAGVTTAATIKLSPKQTQQPAAAGQTADCGASDANLLFQRQRICSSLTQQHTTWCGDSWKNVSKDIAHEDWPSQATYMHAIVAALASSTTCLNTVRCEVYRSFLFPGHFLTDQVRTDVRTGKGLLDGE